MDASCATRFRGLVTLAESQQGRRLSLQVPYKSSAVVRMSHLPTWMYIMVEEIYHAEVK